MELSTLFLEIGFGSLASLLGIVWKIHRDRISEIEDRLREIEHEVIRLVAQRDM